MPKIKVNTNGLEGFSSRLYNVLGKIGSIKSSFDSTAGNLDWDIKIESNINNRLNKISNELESEMNGINGMISFLQEAKEQYDTVNQENARIGIKDNGNWDYKSLLSDFIKAGIKSVPFGKTAFGCWDIYSKSVDMFAHIADGEDFGYLVKDALGVAKGIITVYGGAKASYKVVKAVKDLGKDKNLIRMPTVDVISKTPDLGDVWKTGVYSESGSDIVKKVLDVKKDFFLGYEYLKNPATQSFVNMVSNGTIEVSKGKVLSNVFASEFSERINDTVHGAGLVGTVITVASKGVENYLEYKEGSITKSRAIQECAVESIIEIGKGIVIGSAVAAVGATVGAPFIAVAAGTALVSAGIDFVAEGVTGKKFTEALSDAFLDLVSDQPVSRVSDNPEPYFPESENRFGYAI